MFLKERKMNIRKTVDELGSIKAKIAELKNLEDQLKKSLIDSGLTAAEGQLFRASVSRSQVETVDWCAVAARLDPSIQLITAHTRVRERTTVRCTARNGRSNE